MIKIQVLMSTYNGEKYIAKQLESILKQKNVNLKILIRDDGSSDKTVEIIEIYRRDNPKRISYYAGPNVGVIASFYDLIEKCSKDFEYYAFSDQDDVWLEYKLYRATSLLTQEKKDTTPLLYCSRTLLVDKQLNPIGYWPSLPKKHLSIYNALVENIAVGCTIVLNKKALNLINNFHPNYKNIIMHDWWMYICVSAFGKIIYDKESFLLYRQHGENHIGGESNVFEKWGKKLMNYLNGKNTRIRTNQASEFLNFIKDMDNQKSLFQSIKWILEYPNYTFLRRFLILFKSKLYRQSLSENLILRYLIFIGKL